MSASYYGSSNLYQFRKFGDEILTDTVLPTYATATSQDGKYGLCASNINYGSKAFLVSLNSGEVVKSVYLGYYDTFDTRNTIGDEPAKAIDRSAVVLQKNTQPKYVVNLSERIFPFQFYAPYFDHKADLVISDVETSKSYRINLIDFQKIFQKDALSDNPKFPDLRPYSLSGEVYLYPGKDQKNIVVVGGFSGLVAQLNVERMIQLIEAGEIETASTTDCSKVTLGEYVIQRKNEIGSGKPVYEYHPNSKIGKECSLTSRIDFILGETGRDLSF